MNKLSIRDVPLLVDIRQLINSARQRVAVAVNAELTALYWQIGRRINAEVLKGQRGEYGKQLVSTLAQQLTVEYGRGWGERQLWYCVQVAEVFADSQILNTLCSELTWSHLRLLIAVNLLDSSFPRRRESIFSAAKTRWAPAYAGVTTLKEVMELERAPTSGTHEVHALRADGHLQKIGRHDSE